VVGKEKFPLSFSKTFGKRVLIKFRNDSNIISRAFVAKNDYWGMEL
jgi:hypothetical protein